MPEFVTFDKENKLIFVKSIGIVTEDEVRSSIRQMAAIKKEMNANKALVNQLEATSFPANVPNFNLGSDAAYLLKGLRVAIIPSEAIKYQMEFFEQVATARGGAIQLFGDEESAIAWLHK